MTYGATILRAISAEPTITALALVYCALTGDLRLGAAFLTTGSRGAVLATFGSVTFVYIGMYPLLQIVQTFDATQAQVVTSLRKAVTFVASFVLYPKPFTFMHFVGLLFSLAGAYYLEKELMHGRPGGKVSESPAPPSSSAPASRFPSGGRMFARSARAAQREAPPPKEGKRSPRKTGAAAHPGG